MPNGNEIGRNLLVANLETAIGKLNIPKPENIVVCSLHDGLHAGILVLLQIEKARLTGEVTNPKESSIKIGNITVSGTMGVLVVGLGYVLLKIHGFIP